MIPTGSPRLRHAAVHVRLEDVTRADAAARVIAETVIGDVRHDGGADTTVPFELVVQAAGAIDPQRSYCVRAWVDADADGSRGAGDLYSDLALPVLTHGFGNDVTILVRP